MEFLNRYVVFNAKTEQYLSFMSKIYGSSGRHDFLCWADWLTNTLQVYSGAYDPAFKAFAIKITLGSSEDNVIDLLIYHGATVEEAICTKVIHDLTRFDLYLKDLIYLVPYSTIDGEVDFTNMFKI